MVMIDALGNCQCVIKRWFLRSFVQGGEGEQCESLNFRLPLHLRVPQNKSRHDDERHIGYNGGDGGCVSDDEEDVRRCTSSLSTDDQGWCP
jgi:hypothetical protein